MTTTFTRCLAVAALTAGLVIGFPGIAHAANTFAPMQPATTASETSASTTTGTAKAPSGKPTTDPRSDRAKENQASKMVLRATVPTSQYGEVTVTGNGFPKKQEVTVVISSGSALKAVGYAQVRANGRFSIDLAPWEPWQQGTYQVWVSYPGGAKETTFTITKDLPSTGTTALSASTPTAADAAITLTGTDFAPHTTIRIWVQERGTSIVPVSTQATTDAGGNFTVTANPDERWWPNTTYVAGALDANGQQVEFTFTTPAW